MKLTEKQAQAVLALRTSPHFREILNAIGDRAEVLMQQLINAPREKLEVQQGRTQELTEFINAIADAETTVEAYRQQKENDYGNT